MTWHENAECLNHDPTLWETHNPNQTTRANAEAIEVCNGCPVRLDCLAETMGVEKGATAARYHIYGGLTPVERAKLDDGPRRRKRMAGAA